MYANVSSLIFLLKDGFAELWIPTFRESLGRWDVGTLGRWDFGTLRTGFVVIVLLKTCEQVGRDLCP